MDLQANSSISAGTGTVWISPAVAGWDIDLGSADASGSKLELSAAELNTITAGVLGIGEKVVNDVTAGSLNISQPIAPTGTTKLNLVAGGTITQSGSGAISENELLVEATGSATMAGPNQVSKLAADVTGNFEFNNTLPFTIDTVLNIDGVTAGGTVTLNADGALTTATGKTVKSDNLTIQSTGAGQVGTQAIPFATEVATTSTVFSIGNAAFNGGYFNHTGAAALSSVSLATDKPFAFKATSDLSVNSTINTGTADLKLAAGSGGMLTVGSTFHFWDNPLE